MTAAGIDLLMARREAESEMHETCTITKPGEKVWNPDTLQYDETTVTTYTGRCKLRFGKVQARRGEAEGQLFVEQSATLSLPFSEPTAADVGKDQTVTITASDDDDALVGLVVQTVKAVRQTNATARRFQVKETQ